MSLVIPAPAPVHLPVAGGGLFPVHRIYCVGRNYVDHAKEMGGDGREPPFFFLKPTDAAVPVADGHTGSIPYPTLTRDFHYEIELVVAIGKGGSHIAAADAVNHIYGYAVGLDMTRRDLQSDMKKAGRPWSIGKGFDHSAPIGPIHPRASTGEIQKGGITLKVNGQMRQNSDVSLLIWNVAETIEQLSKGWTLQPGDLIFTGTPAGIGPVVSGDVMEGAADGLGTLRVAVA